jgi:hypothetical protein
MHSPLARSSISDQIPNPPWPKVAKSGCEHSNDHISTVPTPNANMLQPECRGQPDFPSFQNSIEEKVCVPNYDLRKTANKSAQTRDLSRANTHNWLHQKIPNNSQMQFNPQGTSPQSCST